MLDYRGSVPCPANKVPWDGEEAAPQRAKPTYSPSCNRHYITSSQTNFIAESIFQELLDTKCAVVVLEQLQSQCDNARTLGHVKMVRLVGDPGGMSFVNRPHRDDCGFVSVRLHAQCKWMASSPCERHENPQDVLRL